MMPATATHHMRRVAKTTAAMGANANANANVGFGASTSRRSVNANANANAARGHAAMPRATATTMGKAGVAPRPSNVAANVAAPKPTATSKTDPADGKTCALLLAFFRKPDLARLYSREKTLANDLRGVVQQLVAERDDARRELKAMRRPEMVNTLKDEEDAKQHQPQSQRRDSFASTASTTSTPSTTDAEAASSIETTPVTPSTATPSTTTTMFGKMAQGHVNDPLLSFLWDGLRDDPALASLHTPIDATGNGDDLVSRMRRRVRAMEDAKKTPRAIDTKVAQSAAASVASKASSVSVKPSISVPSTTAAAPSMASESTSTTFTPPATTFDLMAKGNASDPELLMMWESLRNDPAQASLHTPNEVVTQMRTRLRAMKSNNTKTRVASQPPTTKTVFDFSRDPQLHMMWNGLRDDPVLASLHAPMAGAADGTDLLSRIRRKVAIVKARNAKIAEAKRLHEEEETKAAIPTSVTPQSVPSVDSAAALHQEASISTALPMTTTMFDKIAQGHASDRLQSFLWESLRGDPALASLHTPMDTTGHGEDLLSRIRRKVREVKLANAAR